MEENSKIKRTPKHERNKKTGKYVNFIDGKFMTRLSKLQGNDIGDKTADEINISTATWSDYKNGIKLPGIQNAIKIAEKFKVSLDWLFSPEDNEDTVNGKFFKRLRQLQGDKNEKEIKEIAKNIGVSTDIWASYVKGERVPTLQIALKIANEFKVSLDWLFSPNEDYEVKREDIDPSKEAKQSFLTLANLIEGKSNIWKVMEHGIRECGNPQFDYDGNLQGGCDAKYYQAAIVAEANVFSDFIEEYDKFFKSVKSLMEESSIEKIEQTYYEKKTKLINESVNDYLMHLEKVNSKK